MLTVWAWDCCVLIVFVHLLVGYRIFKKCICLASGLARVYLMLDLTTAKMMFQLRIYFDRTYSYCIALSNSIFPSMSVFYPGYNSRGCPKARFGLWQMMMEPSIDSVPPPAPRQVCRAKPPPQLSLSLPATANVTSNGAQSSREKEEDKLTVDK